MKYFQMDISSSIRIHDFVIKYMYGKRGLSFESEIVIQKQ